MVDLGEFDFTDVPVRQGRDPIPAGEYRVAVTATEQTPTKNGDGMYVNATFEILEGEHKGRRLWHKFHFWNKSDRAVKISKELMASLMHAAVGHANVKRTEELYGVPVVAVVKTTRKEETQDPINEIKSFKAVRGAAPPKAAPKAEQQQEEDSPPWG